MRQIFLVDVIESTQALEARNALLGRQTFIPRRNRVYYTQNQVSIAETSPHSTQRHNITTSRKQPCDSIAMPSHDPRMA